MDYFSSEEKEAILKEEYDFDRELIHRIYRDIILKVEGYQEVTL